MGKDYRPIILDKLTKKLEQPRSTLRECLLRWKSKDKCKTSKK